MQDAQQPATVPASSASEPLAGWQFTGGSTGQSAPNQTLPEATSVEWTASEFIAHHKSAGWYALLGLLAAVSGAAAYLLAGGEIFTPAVIGIVAILFGIMASRQPRELPYKIDSTGIHIGNKHYPFAGFKSFSVVQEEGVESIWLLPLQRFSPGLSIYFAPEDRDRIMEILDNYLPVEEKQLDMVDRFMHKIRF